ncbi:MAG: hypothetical protein E3J25_06680 [Anaerolineales bacterium]|nr:MAG: hypothetical protein E3J25_06680 [Anaerolineales bacterium]
MNALAPLEAGFDSLARWRKLRPSHKQMLGLGIQRGPDLRGKDFLHVRIGQLEVWGNAFMLLVGNPPDMSLRAIADWSDMQRLLEPGACLVKPLVYLEANGYSPQDRSLLIMAMMSPTDGALMEHLTVNARMALFIDRECRARFPEGWAFGWRGNLSAEARMSVGAKVHPRPLTYGVRNPDGQRTASAVLMPRTAGTVTARDGSLAVRYHTERRVYCPVDLM